MRERQLVHTFDCKNYFLQTQKFKFDLPPDVRELVGYFVTSPTLATPNSLIGQITLHINTNAQQIYSGQISPKNPATQTRRNDYMELPQSQPLDLTGRVSGMYVNFNPAVAAGATYQVKVYLKVLCDD